MTIIKNIISLFFCLIVFINCHSQAAKDNQPLSSQNQQSIIANFSRELINNYIYPDSAKIIISKLDSAYKNGYFTSINNKNFGEQCSALIKTVVHDNHLGIKYKSNYQTKEQPGPMPRMRPREIGADGGEMHEPVAFKIMDNNIGYLRLDMFDDQPIFYDKIDDAFQRAANTKAFIIDLTTCRGGSPKAENYIISYLLQPGIQLTSIFQQANGKTSEEKFFTLQSVKEKRYTEQPVYLLTGSKTFSAAENFCYDLQALQRATVIGVNTLGGANPGREFALGQSFYAFIPTGRSYNNITKTNWEGVGIRPDVSTSEKEALPKAISLINNK